MRDCFKNFKINSKPFVFPLYKSRIFIASAILIHLNDSVLVGIIKPTIFPIESLAPTLNCNL